MKAKKIVMTISLFLFVLGLLLAFKFTFTNAVCKEWEQILVNMSIGLSTGGLVALLIEIPMTASTIAANKRLLKTNSYHVYYGCAALITLLESACENEDKPIYENFCTPVFDRINHFVLPLLNIDPHIYQNSVKREKIIWLIATVNM